MNLWLFGGLHFPSVTTQGQGLNDLWEFNPTTKEWTWVSGSNTNIGGGGPSGVYGTLDVAAASNVPGGRSDSTSWIDSSGNYWLFGGYGNDSTGGSGFLNDLWEFNPTSKEWTWVSGSNTVTAGAWGLPGTYGALDTASSSSIPGGRSDGAGWIDSSGNLWLFGGNGVDSAGVLGSLNDLWEFNPTTKEWTWMSGSNTAGANGIGQPGVYGTKGIAAASNIPGGRSGSLNWVDGSNTLWLLGGVGNDSAGKGGGVLNDLWEFNTTTKEWTWISGSSTAGESGVYGTRGGAPAANYIPGGRYDSAGWIDSSGTLWLFGGDGIDSHGVSGYLDDLWHFQP